MAKKKKLIIRRNAMEAAEAESVVAAKKSIGLFNWLQEFSKIIVSIGFLIYVLISLFTIIHISWVYSHTGDALSLDVLIEQANETFRVVIGGYILKAAVENAIKISSSILDKKIAAPVQTAPVQTSTIPNSVVVKYGDIQQDVSGTVVTSTTDDDGDDLIIMDLDAEEDDSEPYRPVDEF